MLDRYIGLGVAAITLALSAQAQTVSFSSPVPWVTQRNDTISVKAQVDTAQIKQKSLAFKLSQVSKGKKKEIASKKVTVSDVSVDVSFGSIKKQLLGGDEYLQVEWSIPGSTDKGTVEPIGIVPESIFKDLAAVTATKVKDAQGLSGLKDEQFQILGDVKIAAAWNMDACFFAIKKGADAKSIIKCAFDGKNGKSAFLSYPDRIVSFNAQNDTLNTIHYTRELNNDTLVYKEGKWNSSIKKEVMGDVVVITVPWSDVGVIPFDDRTVGFAMFAEGSDGKVTQSNPANAKLYIPGTWTNLLLAK
jgi:hypothetical protein